MTLCEHCMKKKVGIMPFSCKCEFKNLCRNCRLPEAHKCTYDFKTEERKKLAKDNPVVIASKIEII